MHSVRRPYCCCVVQDRFNVYFICIKVNFAIALFQVSTSGTDFQLALYLILVLYSNHFSNELRYCIYTQLCEFYY